MATINLGIKNEQLEFKRSTSEMREAMSSIAAILNKHGEGELCFGIRKDGQVCMADGTKFVFHRNDAFSHASNVGETYAMSEKKKILISTLWGGIDQCAFCF